MVQPRRIRALTPTELQHLTVERLLAYRKQALCLENNLAASDYTETAHTLDIANFGSKTTQDGSCSMIPYFVNSPENNMPAMPNE